MPSNITAAASLNYTGGSIRCARIVPARLRYTGGTFTSSKDTPLTTAAVIPQLNRLFRLVDKVDGETDKQFQRRQQIWQTTMEAIEAAFEAVNARVDEVALYARLSAVETAAQVANDNVATLTTTVTTIQTATENTFTEIDPLYGQDFSDRLDP